MKMPELFLVLVDGSGQKTELVKLLSPIVCEVIAVFESHALMMDSGKYEAMIPALEVAANKLGEPLKGLTPRGSERDTG